ncbi:hypothetical protein COCON_G00153870 [Conger conger]|uniref:Ig-like domain-containing protein n=1 Tax=Conger conger TaxID=82655 RepID=A0A9Q1HUL5_CONCO|nr:T-cell surface glycoprotein CD8 alpha chain-like [Conger conger]KAJ8262930.1 hypothetical protein COCON_G00153870 [Conger conger]
MFNFFICLLFLLSLGRYTDCKEDSPISDGTTVPIKCDLKDSLSTVLWFRVGNTGMEVLGFVDSNGVEPKDSLTIKSKALLEIKKFNKKRDSGVYGCSAINGKILTFGKTTTLRGPADPTTTTTRRVTTATPPNTTTTPCPCRTGKKYNKESPDSCETAILAPLVAGCILLFLILILTIRHCSRVRTRGCPHHHKRRPRNPAQVNLGKPGRYV